MITEQFKNGKFYEVFHKVKDIIPKIDKKTIPDAKALKGFNRIKKVIKYINTYIEMTDWELFTENELRELNGISGNSFYYCFDRLQYCINENFNGSWQQQITQANEYLDSILPIVKNIFPKFILPKQNIKNVFTEYSETIQNHLDEIDFDTSLQASNQIKELLENNRIEKINNFFDEIFKGDDTLENKKEIIYRKIEELNDKITNSANKQEELNQFHAKIFGVPDEETGELKDGLKNEIEQRKDELKQYKESQEKVLQTLRKQIEGLMPNATSVGLAKAFSDEKENFKKEIKKWNTIFISSIAMLVIFSGVKLFFFKVDFTTLQSTLTFVLSGLPVILPLVWLAIFCAKRRSENSMLLQEYTHKETFANSYSSYKQQIEDLQEQETLLKELLKKAVAIISKNPTVVLDKKHSGDLPIEELKKTLEKAIEKKLNPQ